MSDQLLQALCCICGQLRTCRRPRNRRWENRWLMAPVNRDWHRETGDLKCAECNRITTHALITNDNHAEQIHKMAIGWTFKNITDRAHERVRKQWREGLPQNPFLYHHWWVSDETAARKAGETHVLTLCKIYTPLPKKANEPGTGVDRDVLMKPRCDDEDEYLDPNTGLYWTDMSCPDCLRRSNAIAIEDQRKALKNKLIEIVAKVDHLDAPTVTELLANFGDNEVCES